MLTEEQIKNAKEVHVYTDGACSPNPGPGGWGAVIVNPRSGGTFELSGAPNGETSNNKMELTGPIRALELLLEKKGPQFVRVFSDSKYVINGVTNWIHGWKKKDWRLSNGDPVKNVELWKRLDAARTAHKLVVFEWVPGHAGIEHNERADRLAVAARARQTH
ncbi:MAG: ribonuclease HI [Mameliella sp.]|nr:ribonuclease HI [Mameliella sp.]